MGKVDATLERYLDDPVRYADLLNGYRFQGCQVVKPEDVFEKDTRLSGRSRRRKQFAGKGDKNSARDCQKQRDVVRKVVFGTGVAVVALEDQNLIHYAMPIRVMLEDSLEYDKQMRAIQREHQRNKDLTTPEEYVGQFSAEDRIIPTITIVLYLGEDAWNGPRDLLDLMPLEDLPAKIRQLVNGYPLHILEVRKLEDLECFQTDLREVFGIIQNAASAERLDAYIQENSERLDKLTEDAFEVIVAVTDDKILDKIKTECRKEDGTMGLHNAFTELAEKKMKDAQVKGHALGHALGHAEGHKLGYAEGQIDERRNIAIQCFFNGIFF